MTESLVPIVIYYMINTCKSAGVKVGPLAARNRISMITKSCGSFFTVGLTSSG